VKKEALLESLSNFHPIYLIFPLCLIFLLLFKESKLKTCLIVIGFIFIFVFAETGADYNGYKEIYEKCLNEEVHGEFLFVALCKCFKLIGVSYNCFRIIFLTSFIILFAYSLSNMTKNFTLSFLIAYLMYVVYFVSALRQFATMAILFYSLYLYLNKNKTIIPIILNIVAVFIHTLALVQLLVLTILIFYEKTIKKKKSIEKGILKKWFLIVFFSCLVLRLILFVVLKTSFGAILVDFLPYKNLSLINLGLISRVVILICLTNLYVGSKDSDNSNLLFSVYFIGLLLYLIFPFELIMGRLINNIKMLEILLIPSLISSFELKKHGSNTKSVVFKICVITLIIAICLIFLSQLVVQIGYNEYVHMLWG